MLYFRGVGLTILLLLASTPSESEAAGRPLNGKAYNAMSPGEQDAANVTADYSMLSKLLAGMLVLREGSIADATRAIPTLSAMTHHFLNTQVSPPVFCNSVCLLTPI